MRAPRDQVVRTARLAFAGTLGVGLSQQVGNPLGAILEFLDVARARARRDGADTEILDAIRDEAVRIDRIVRELRHYACPGRALLEPRCEAHVVERVRGPRAGGGALVRNRRGRPFAPGTARRAR